MIEAKRRRRRNHLPRGELASAPPCLSGRSPLVSGGATGIGRAISLELAELGATVVIASRNQAKCEQAAEEMNRSLGRAAAEASMVAWWQDLPPRFATRRKSKR